jgi:hypothetical protein
MDRPIVQCMGGWCKKREQCAHYWAPKIKNRAPIDRLCGKGVDEPEPIPEKVEEIKVVKPRKVYKSPHSYESNVLWKIRHPKAWNATKVVFVALRAGKLLKTACEICGEEKSEAHHVHHDAPLLVVWLCKLHHTQTHKEFRKWSRNV